MEGNVQSQRGKKRPIAEIADDTDVDVVYKFKILLPDGMSLGLNLHEPRLSNLVMPLQEFVDLVRTEYFRVLPRLDSPRTRKKIMWKSKDLHLVDDSENRIRQIIDFKDFRPRKCHILRLNDGSSQSADTFENMWDLTPDTELLAELPEEYTFETALADLIDNSLQAVWSNSKSERRLISVDIVKDRISIFDSGPGMDGSENSIVKWGKMGASLHRPSKAQAIGGKPPYLKPFFGMFGYGGPIASMHLGRRALVSSKTKESKKVYTLHLEREALLSNSGSDLTWRTAGGIRDPSEEEREKSPHGSFTKVEIFEPKIRSLDIFQLQRKLKDIYFPYIQCDELCDTGKTNTPVQFQVNGLDLAEIDGGEVGTTNLHSSNGPEFSLQLRFYVNRDNVAIKSPSLKLSQEANARLKCVYFPIIEGKENLETVLEKLEAEGCGTNEKYDSFSRVSIRRLGRLLPDARWSRLPFMEPKQKKGDKGQLLKRCCLRVKCFIDTDAGFNPTPSKTDLAHHNPFTSTLKDFGNKPSEKGREINVEIYRDGKSLSLLQLEKEYLDWIFQMHDLYDEEFDSGEDQPVIVVGSLNKKQLGISSDVIRVHQIIRRKGTSWKRGQKIKVLKGACPGYHKNVFATLEYILLEGFQGDAGGEARLICRPLGLPDEDGCILAVNDGSARIDCRSALSLPISVIDSGKCLVVKDSEWLTQLDKQRQKAPSAINILREGDCLELEVDGALPDAPVYAGHVPPKEIVAVIRPASFVSSSSSKNLDQKYIIKDNLELSMEVKLMSDSKNTEHICSNRVTPSPRNGFHGLYIFPLRCKFPKLFQKAGLYIFKVFLKGSSLKSCERRVVVKALPKASSWKLLSVQNAAYSISVGSCFPPFSIARYDVYENKIPFTSIPEFVIKTNWNGGVLAHANKMKTELSSDNLVLTVKNVWIESNNLDKLRPSYEAKLMICPRDELSLISVPFEVNPGILELVIAKPPLSVNQLLPGCVIEELILEMFDEYRNHVREGLEVEFKVEGFCFQDQNGLTRKVDERGCVDLSGLLRVTAGYGKNVSLSVLFDKEVVFKEEFQTDKRELRAAPTLPKVCAAGSQLENVGFEIVNSKGEVDETVHDEEKHGKSHTLTITSTSMDGSVRFAFRNGLCTVPSIPLPQMDGFFTFVAAHSRHPELSLTVKVLVKVTPKVKQEEVQLPSPNANMLLLQDSSAPKHVENLVELLMSDMTEIEDQIFNIGLFIGDHEKQLELLDKEKTEMEQSIDILRASMDSETFNNLDYLSKKGLVMKRIEQKDKSAASFFCNLSSQFPFQDPQCQLMKDTVGVVALLGTVQINSLSRMLAEYLGEDQMLAVVCTSYDAASKLEKYEWNGKVDHEHALYAKAKEFGQSINDRFLVICLENISPFRGGFKDDDPQRKLNIPNPVLSTGKLPEGFLGYAVNMVSLENEHLSTRTALGHGLRETLFYCLFGELQVYQTREDMKKACSYAKHGAVSLDGGIMRGNGVISFGHREPQILFPAATMESPKNKRILEMIEEERTLVRIKLNEMGKLERVRAKAQKKLKKKIAECNKLMSRIGPWMRGYYLEYNTNSRSSHESSPK